MGRRVVFVTLAAGLGGGARSLVTVLDELDDCHRVVVGRPGTKVERMATERRLFEEWIDLGHESVRSRAGRLRDAWHLRRALRSIEGTPPIHANGLSELLVVAAATLGRRARIVLWLHNADCTWWTAAIVRAWARTRRDLRVAPVSDAAAGLAESIGLGGRTGKIVANPIDPTDVSGERVELIDGDPARIVFLGSPGARKGFDLLPELARHLGRVEPRCELHVYAGPRSMAPKTFEELEAEPTVHLHGKTPDVASAYARAEVVVMPSRRESFGRVALEAMANGIPVVAFAAAGVGPLVEAAAAGVLVPLGDVERLAAEAAALAGDPERRAALGAHGVRYAARFEPAAITEQLRELYFAP